MKTLIAALALFALGYGALTTVIIVGVSDANKAQQRALVCFDKSGKPTLGDDWRECHLVAIREL